MFVKLSSSDFEIIFFLNDAFHENYGIFDTVYISRVNYKIPGTNVRKLPLVLYTFIVILGLGDL